LPIIPLVAGGVTFVYEVVLMENDVSIYALGRIKQTIERFRRIIIIIP
jgi:hypothetical protein